MVAEANVVRRSFDRAVEHIASIELFTLMVALGVILGVFVRAQYTF